jgi:hypothetical protein
MLLHANPPPPPQGVPAAGTVCRHTPIRRPFHHHPAPRSTMPPSSVATVDTMATTRSFPKPPLRPRHIHFSPKFDRSSAYEGSIAVIHATLLWAHRAVTKGAWLVSQPEPHRVSMKPEAKLIFQTRQPSEPAQTELTNDEPKHDLDQVSSCPALALGPTSPGAAV